MATNDRDEVAVAIVDFVVVETAAVNMVGAFY